MDIIRKKRRKIIVISTILLTCLITLGYAVLTTTLNISGQSTIEAASWNIFFDSINVDSNSVSAPNPTINTAKDTVNFEVSLDKPGDFYEFTVDVKNTGTIDAMINTITKTNLTTQQAKYLNYTVTYSDGVELASKHILNSNSTETYKVRVEFKKDIQTSDLNQTGETVNLSFGVNYIQKTNQAITRPTITYLYTVDYPNNEFYQIGQPLPTASQNFTNYNDAVTNHGYPFFLRHKISNNIISESYVGFVLNGNVYYLKGGDGEAYETNKTTLLNAFGSNNCYIDDSTNISCYDSASGLGGDASGDYGYVYAIDDDRHCSVYSDGYSNCGNSGE